MVVPEKSGSQRAVAVTAETLVLGLPPAVLKPFDAAPVADEVQPKCGSAALCLPPVRSMLAESAHTLARHQVMTKVRHGTAAAGSSSGDTSPSARSAHQGGMDGVVNSGARLMREWFREKLNKAKDAISGIAHQEEDHTHAAARTSAQQAQAESPPAVAAHAGPAAHAAAAAEASGGGDPGGVRPEEGSPADATNQTGGTAGLVMDVPLRSEGGALAAVTGGPPASVEVQQPRLPPPERDRAVHFSSVPGGAPADDAAGHRGGQGPGPQAAEAAHAGAPAEAATAAGPEGEEPVHTPMDTGIGNISEPMFAFVATGYKVCSAEMPCMQLPVPPRLPANPVHVLSCRIWQMPQARRRNMSAFRWALVRVRRGI